MKRMESLAREIGRWISASIALGALIGLLPAASHAGVPPPTGTISCDIVANPPLTKHEGLQFRPNISSVARNVGLQGGSNGSSCDISNVTGGKAPIIGVKVKFHGVLPATSCATLTSAPQYVRAKVHLRWIGLNANNHAVGIASNHAKVAGASYDAGTHALIITTESLPLKKPFAGKTVTLHLGLDAFGQFEPDCGPGMQYRETTFGTLNPSSVVVQ